MVSNLAVLTPSQRHASDLITAEIDVSHPKPILLDGVTGSGKTEVYFEIIKKILHLKKQVLVLLPEISLVHGWVTRFEQRFGFPPLVWHSGITPAQRHRVWTHVLTGHPCVIVGARSSLFLPFSALGLIIVDEEHDHSYKQEESVIYQGRDMAVLRGHIQQIPVVLASATPSLETLSNVAQGRYLHAVLTDRFGSAGLPQIHVIDMRMEYRDKGQRFWISPTLMQAIKETFQRKEQSILFLNRRGYAPLTLCSSCGHKFSCPHCSTWLVDHRTVQKLMCHHCGFTLLRPSTCPSCHDHDTLIPCGPGVERLMDEIKERLPDAHIAMITSDTIDDLGTMESILKSIHDQDIDIIVGTQIMSKGHDFPLLTLVGVVDADLGLGGADLRAAEKTYQLLHQVAGRSGRKDHPGQVFLQTYQPEHPVLEALCAGDRDSFLALEFDDRRSAGLPPFGRLASIILSGRNPSKVEQTARHMGATCPIYNDVRVMGPAPSPIHKLRGDFRWRFLIKSPRAINIQHYLKNWLKRCTIPPSIQIKIDIDPYSFL